MKDFIKMLIVSIVEYPQDIQIEQSTDDAGEFYQVRVNKKDMGMLIGKGGEHISAIKLIVKLAGFRQNKKVFVKVEEPEKK